MATYMTGIKYGGYLSTAAVSGTATASADLVTAPSGQVWEVYVRFIGATGLGGAGGGDYAQIRLVNSSFDWELIDNEASTQITKTVIDFPQPLILEYGSKIDTLQTGSGTTVSYDFIVVKYTA